MNDANKMELANSILSIQIDGDTWLQLSALCDRLLGSLGLVGPILELAQVKSETEQVRHLCAIKDRALNGQAALKQFARLWADLAEQVIKDRIPPGAGNFEDILEAARENPIQEVRLRWSAGKSIRSPAVAEVPIRSEHVK
jgi:hypothetical protein